MNKGDIETIIEINRELIKASGSSVMINGEDTCLVNPKALVAMGDALIKLVIK